MADPHWYSEARRLRASGMGYRTIARALGRHDDNAYTTIRHAVNPVARLKRLEAMAAWYAANSEAHKATVAYDRRLKLKARRMCDAKTKQKEYKNENDARRNQSFGNPET